VNDRLSVLRLGIGLALRAGGWRLPVVAVCTIALAVQPAVNALAFKLVTNGAVTHHWTEAVTGVATIAAMVVLMFSAYGISVPLQTSVSERARQIFEQDVMALVASISTLEPHERPDFADRLEVLRNNSGMLIGAVWTALSNLSFFVGAFAVLGLLAGVDPLLVVLPVFGVPLSLVTARAARTRDRAIGQTAELSRQAHHLFQVATRASFGKEVRVFGLRDEVAARYDRVTASASREMYSAGLRAGLLEAGAWLLFAAAWAAGIALVVYRARRGYLTPGDVVVTITVAAVVQNYVSGATGLVKDLTQSLAMARRYLWLLDFARSRPAGRVQPPARLVHGIRLDHVCFTYPGTDTEVLHDVDVLLPAGSTVGIVGDNGAGKTSLVKLLLGLYQPTKGSITVDGVRLADMDIVAWQSRTAGAFQDFAKLEFTIGESVGVGDLPKADDRVAVDEALNRAGSTLRLPLSQQLGRSWEDGIDISVGQWQQVAVGRGLMRTDPLVLVLDEPTASLDAETEHALFERYRDATRRRSARNGGVSLLISHRFSSVRMADLIVVFDQGALVECGTHEELVNRGALYAELFELQARAYQ
jgi:ATP-binding cassette, subfamily B, bacterial